MARELLTLNAEDSKVQEAIRTETAIEDVKIEPVKTVEKAHEETVSQETKPEEPVKVITEPVKRERVVPIQAVHEERQKRQALQRELDELRSKAAPKPAEIPDETTDPIGAIAALKRENAQYAAERQHQHALQDLGQRIAARIQPYAAEHPEYGDQYRYLQNSRATELRELGHDEGAIARQIQAEEMQLGALALERDMDPGEMISKLAKVRGWAPKAAAKTEEIPALTNPLAPAQAALASQGAETIERLAKGQKAATTSSRSGGESPRGALTIEDGLKLNGAAFDSWVKGFMQSEKANGNWN